jgi:hypothetical protein
LYVQVSMSSLGAIIPALPLGKGSMQNPVTAFVTALASRRIDHRGSLSDY